jgi:hypothetical protein
MDNVPPLARIDPINHDYLSEYNLLFIKDILENRFIQSTLSTRPLVDASFIDKA